MNKSVWKYPYCYFCDVISPQDCDAIIAVGKELTENSGKVNIANALGATTKNTKVRRAKTAFFSAGHALERVLQKYVTLANQQAWNFNISGHEPIQFGKYGRGGFYNWHADSYYNTDAPLRKLSITVNLSDPTKYVGGNFEMKNTQDEKLELPTSEIRQQGTIIVFPSFLQHRVSEVKSGTRYSLVQWINGPDFI